MKIDHDSQALGENHLDGGVESGERLGSDFKCMSPAEHGLRIYAEPNVIKTHGLDERNILRGRPCFKMLFGVSAWIVDLSKPLTQINSMAQPGRTLCGGIR